MAGARLPHGTHANPFHRLGILRPMNIKLRFSAIAAVLLLAACGNKGPLVMPQQPVPVEQEVPAPSPVEPAPATDPVPAAEPEPASEDDPAAPATPAEGTDG